MGCASSKGEDVQDTAGTRGSKSNKLVVTTAKGANGRLNGQQQDNRGEKEVTVLGYDDADLAEFEREYQADQAKAEAERTHKEETEREEEARAKAAAAEEARRKEEEYIKFEKEQQAEQRALEKDLQEGKRKCVPPRVRAGGGQHPAPNGALARYRDVLDVDRVNNARETLSVKEYQQQSFMRERKLCIFGYGSAGKTSIVEQFTLGTFSHEHFPATNKTSTKVVRRKGHDYAIHMLDTVGQDECGFFDPQYTIGTDGYMLVFSAINLESFEMVKRIYNDLWAYTPLVPFVLVATKIDLSHERVVSEQEGRDLAASWGCEYFEVSSRSGQSVQTMVSHLLDKVDVAYEDSDSVAKPVQKRDQTCVLQ